MNANSQGPHEAAFDRVLSVREERKSGGVRAIIVSALPIVVAAYFANMVGRPASTLMVWAAVMWSVFLRKRPPPLLRRAKVTASADGVRVAGTLVAPRSAVASGYFQPGVTPSVHLTDAAGKVLFEADVENEREALALLGALGLDPSRRSAAFNGASPIYATRTRRVLVFAAALAFVLGGSLGLAALGVTTPWLAILLGPALLAAAWPSRIVVGVDGILVRWLRGARFIPMATVRSAVAEGGSAIRLTLLSSEEVVLRPSAASYPRAASTAEARRTRESSWRVSRRPAP